jgi:hypothetical protein
MSPTIQPRFGEDIFPVGRFVLDRAKALGLSRTDLVCRFGYRDLSSGHRTLTDVLLTGIVPPFIQGKLANALEVDQELLDAVSAATARQIHDEVRSQILAKEDAYRAEFRLHLQVVTERRIPSPIFVAALVGTARLRIVPLPDQTLSRSEDQQDQTVKAAIIKHYRSQDGYVPAFGAITGYVLVLIAGYGDVDFGVPFDVTGNLIGPMRKVERVPEATLGTKRGDTRLTGLLKNELIHADA